MPRPALTALIAFGTVAAVSVVTAPAAAAYEVQAPRYSVVGPSYVDAVGGTVDAEASLYMSNSGALSSVNVWPGREGSDTLHMAFTGPAGSLVTSNGVTLNGPCASAQIQMSPKTTDGLRGTATVICTRSTSVDGATATSRYMVTYGFDKPTLNCVQFSAGGASVRVAAECPGNVSGVTILANGKQERTGVSAKSVQAAFDATAQS